MSSFKNLIIRTTGFVIGSLLLIFSINMLMRRCSKRSNNVSIAVILLFSIGITVFFQIYGRNEHSLTFVNIKMYVMLLASSLIMFCIANLVLRKESECYSKFREQNKKIYFLKIDIANLEIQLNIMKREIEWFFDNLCSDTKICVDIKQEYLLPANKKFYDIGFLCKTAKFVTFSIALVVFLCESFYSVLSQKFDLVGLFMYYVLISLFLFTFIIDRLALYSEKNYKSISQNSKSIIDTLNTELNVKKRMYTVLLQEVSKYNILTEKELVNENNIRTLEKYKNKIFDILDRV
ncbi:putative membrane protein [Ehrlichia chaffeensis str. Liberty]|uniref:Membrane protein n=1 Tax=Ehrlichia chaffeensis (strain ATCC CRL-10679 / Arkansas) TaxID=205920 RepID=Q2GGV0_EHRCR|nr:hypothetical protein [Ehrlichia chaffeensis]ABD45453.1 putative membrane protein [Ehrlichia chaffeensis str. Arkansas]AHX06657.1 putative membrane protein [Ehrlichia chaffeensis str. Liberty]AHX07142.1 putative membrane protein [Ehrlichia chaffeensis str. Osceola]AHX09365.1 putative membrane protein [Ehrlichia chaffeensis str. Wakulla]